METMIEIWLKSDRNNFEDQYLIFKDKIAIGFERVSFAAETWANNRKKQHYLYLRDLKLIHFENVYQNLYSLRY